MKQITVKHFIFIRDYKMCVYYFLVPKQLVVNLDEMDWAVRFLRLAP
jgi:hypothetical protein